MPFNTFPFWFFFALVLLVNAMGPARISRLWLTIASFVFYASWGLALAPLLAVCVLINYGSGLLIGRSQGVAARNALIAAVALNLVILGFFKYYRFLLDSWAMLSPVPEALRIDVVLPVAISFYTFEAISYNVDVYRRELAPRKNLIDFALFLSLFPHLVAGPIIRPAHFFPQLRGRPMPSAEDARWGTLQILKGLIKKMVFADNFALVANPYFNADLGHAGVAAAWSATIAFALQIYFDFAGYTDIARGVARWLGYEFPVNFERPYFAADISDFWRRWHISLSTWLRDYLYIPLGGNRSGRGRTYLNLLITMALGGLWHGANWTFLLWGVYHGLLLGAHRLWRNLRPGPRDAGLLSRAAFTALTFFAVTMGWVLFRAATFDQALTIYQELFGGKFAVAAPPFSVVILAIVAWAWTLLDRDRRLQTWLAMGSGMAGRTRAVAAIALCLFVIEICAPNGQSSPFIYFRF